MEVLQTYGENVVSFQLALGDLQWFIIGYYLAPDNSATIEDVFTAISQRPWGAMLLVVSDFSTNLAAPEGWEWDEGIATAMSEEGLQEMSGHLFPRQNMSLKDGQTWAMNWGGWEVRYRTDYILGTNYR